MGLLNWFRNDKKVEVENQEQSVGINADIPRINDYLFEVNGVTFVGSFIGAFYESLQFSSYDGVLSIDKNESVKVLRLATSDESEKLSRTKNAVEQNYVVRFIQLTDIA